MTSHAGHTISYDSLGNPTNWYTGTKSLSNMTWEGRRLSGLTVSSTAYNYSYNSDGIRIKKQNGSNVIEYLYDDSGNLVEEKHATYSIYFIYDDSGELIGFKVSEGGTYYYGKDVFGVIKYIYNSSGTIVGSYTYDAWGNTISYTCTSETFVNPIRYKDYYYDIETGLYYLQSRYYDPQVGRFISADDVGYLGSNGEMLSYNIYIYCYNNPAIYSDPTGFLDINLLAYGVQLCVNVCGVTIGFEFLWGNTNNNFYVFAFVGGNVSKPLKNSNDYIKKYILPHLKSKSNKLYKALSNSSLSFSFVFVLGNSKQRFPSDYCGIFETISVAIKIWFINIAFSGAIATNTKGIIGSIGVGISTQASLSYSKTYYVQLTGDNALFNNIKAYLCTLISMIKSKIDTIYKAVKYVF